ncbi:MAG: biopolymer transporter ExbD [Planctomycetota bacterium]
MGKRKNTSIQEEISPNLIPMIDIMFLLLLFFMLGADMGQRELEEVVLPQALRIKEDKTQVGVKDDRLVINVYHLYSTEVPCEQYKNREVCRDSRHWRIGIKGKDYIDPEALIKRLQVETEDYRTDPNNPLLVERGVMIRGDRSAPFGEVQKAMQCCAKVGVYKIACGAARPPDADKLKH